MISPKTFYDGNHFTSKTNIALHSNNQGPMKTYIYIYIERERELKYSFIYPKYSWKLIILYIYIYISKI
jgi:hypothetical protein